MRRISHGGGPGELYKLNDIAFDKETNRLIAYQHPFLLHYSSDGEYIEQQKLPFGFYNFVTIPGGYMFKTLAGYGNEHLKDKKNNTLLITDKDFKLKYTALPSPYVNANYGGYCYLYKNGADIQITNNFADTIYHYDSKGQVLTAAYILDYADKKLPSSLLEKQGPLRKMIIIILSVSILKTIRIKLFSSAITIVGREWSFIGTRLQANLSEGQEDVSM